MDNYKIKVKDEAESKEAQELFVKLGYELFKSKRVGIVATEDNGTVYPDVIWNWYAYEGKELTLPQLRDLVVLKRNDINDANWETEGGDQIFKDSNDKSFIYRSDGWDELLRHEMRQAMWEKPKAIAKPQDPTLISGADVLPSGIEARKEWANGQKIQFKSRRDNSLPWEDVDENKHTLDIFRHCYWFRLKPQTIKVELELPKPFEPKEGEEVWFITDDHGCGYSRYEHGEHSTYVFGCWSTEAEVKQVVEQLRKIRGTNS
ncbi:hypothetical protein KPE82_00455 [Acinetobacter baumannii]|uniref:hypothetical protein n=1 Tax=Acinetobacter baumannii TaxID=470 RepID=UPI001C0AD2D6|nr:hypothetical protein [Acinetobacter baumannii]MBU3094077.1 hypothetical protein [Acinetobacter baumannii]